jgi:EAL domain-containing protein (putative c-di-GMP-specific phosphodiesterase class I)
MQDVNHSIGSLLAIRALGVTIAIDDFSTTDLFDRLVNVLELRIISVDRCQRADCNRFSIAVSSSFGRLAFTCPMKFG